MNEPLISVIVPCYNQADFLSDALDSVMAQTYSDWECIIVNDGSPDNTEEVADLYCKKDKRFNYIRKSNGGLSSARNKGLEMATGQFIQFLDSDDIISPKKFETQLTCLKDIKADVLVSDFNFFTLDINNQFDNYLSLQSYDFSLEGFLYKWIALIYVIPIHCGLFDRWFLLNNGIKFDERAKTFEDWIFWSTLALYKPCFYHNPFKLAHYRIHENSMSKDLKRIQNGYLVAAFLIEELLPESKKNVFREKISEILVNRLLISFGQQENSIKANSIDYKFGHIFLFPFHKISGIVKKIVRYIMKIVRLISKEKKSNIMDLLA
jgi:glycosyltransferase involved in cell wall biosynthesis